MGKNRTIDHRRPPRSAGIPMKLHNGFSVPANPEPEVATDEVVQLRKETTQQRGALEEMERKLRTKTAETQALKQALQDARDETNHLRYKHGDGLSQHGGFGLDATHAPAEYTNAVDHGRM